jgi:carboxyl-terminal processing protease
MGGPSIEAGLQIGDKIIKVEEEDIGGIGISNSGVMDRLLGSAGSEVNLTVLRGTEYLEFNLKRGNIPQKSVDSFYMINEEVGYIKISRFGSKTFEEFKTALNELKDQGMVKLILDLQSNPGGLMSAAEKISDELLSGQKLIVNQKSAHDRYNSSTFARIDGIFEEGPVILLVNEYSASASEIVAGAMQDNDRALVVGRRTFGKGLVQMPITLNDRSELRLTIARYYTPSGRSIQKPYENGEDYHADLNARYEHGEFFYADSIKFSDSLKFETAKGRTVYGGGGIMPDYFVPYDTSRNTEYYGNLVGKRAIREFAINYYIENDRNLREMTLAEYLTDFNVIEGMMNELVQIGEELDIEFNADEYATSLPLLRSHLKAEIGSLIWDEDGYYSVMNPVSNEIYIKALELFSEAELLAEAY